MSLTLKTRVASKAGYGVRSNFDAAAGGVAITTQPTAQTANAGANFTFSVSVSPDLSPKVKYQWQRNGADINGATSASYTAAAQSGWNGAAFKCVVSLGAVSIESNAATLTVIALPTITVQPASLVRVTGEAATFGITVSAAGPYWWRWYVNGSLSQETYKASAATDTLTLYAGSSNFGKTIYCEVWDSGQTQHVTSSSVSITDGGIYITVQPIGASLTSGQTLTLSCTANSALTLSYQWQKSADGVAWLNVGTGSSYTKSPVRVANNDAGYYRCVISNSYTSQNTSTASVSVSKQALSFVGPFDQRVQVRQKSPPIGGHLILSFSIDQTPQGPLYFDWVMGTSGADSHVGVYTQTLDKDPMPMSWSSKYFRCLVTGPEDGGITGWAYVVATLG